jgi:hypothetical protein
MRRAQRQVAGDKSSVNVVKRRAEGDRTLYFLDGGSSQH